MPALDTIRRAPKALLHDHLDGGLRPRTSSSSPPNTATTGLPTTDQAELAGLVHPRRRPQVARAVPRDVRPHGRRHAGARRGRPGRPRVRRGPRRRRVVYAEVRYAPELSIGARPLPRRGRRRPGLDGFRVGAERAARGGPPDRHPGPGHRDAPVRPLARDRRPRPALPGRGVVGFDVAGPEAGYRAEPRTSTRSTTSVHASFHLTIHAGEGYGLPSIREALEDCGAERLGHGVRIVDDITVEPDGHVALGRLAAYVRDRRIPLELCPTSNVHTGARGVGRRAPVRPAPPAALPGHAQHRQPAHVERDPVDRVRGPRRGVRHRPRRDGVAHAQRDRSAPSSRSTSASGSSTRSSSPATPGSAPRGPRRHER